MTSLHEFGNLLREVLLLVPLPLVRLLFVTSLVIVLVWVLRLPRTQTTPPKGATRWDENLKPIAAFAMVIQILIYAFL